MRLTAWYAALLVLVLLALGHVGRHPGPEPAHGGRRPPACTAPPRISAPSSNATSPRLSWLASQPSRSVRGHRPDLGSFASRGQLIQITSPDGDVVRSSEYAPWRTDRIRVGEPSGEPKIVSTGLAGDEARAVHFPVTVTDRNGVRWYIGAVIVGERLTTMHETLASLRQVLLVTSALGLAPRPRRRLGAGRTRPATRGPRHRRRRRDRHGRWDRDLPQLPPPGAPDERRARPPLRTFNAMLDRLQASFRAQERFVGDASHELRTPLTAIRGNVDVLLRQARLGSRRLDPTDLMPALDDIRRESDRMRRLARRSAPARPRRCGCGPPNKTARFAASRCGWTRSRGSGALRRGAGFRSGARAEAPRGVEVPGDPDRLHQLVMILLDNAIRHTRQAEGSESRSRPRPTARRASPSATKGKGSPQSTCRTCSSGSTGPMERAAAPQAVQDWGWRSPRPSAGPTAARFR